MEGVSWDRPKTKTNFISFCVVSVGEYNITDILDIFKVFTVCELHCNLKLKRYIDLCLALYFIICTWIYKSS